MDDQPDELRRISYDLAAQSNDGAVPNGVRGTVSFWEVNAQQTLVTIELDEGATGTTVAHPAHIHEAGSGDIAIYLTPIDGSGGEGTSARVVNQSYDALVNFEGYVNVHESVANLGTVVSQGNIGAEASGEEGEGLELVDAPRTTSYTLDANANDGSVVPDGIAAQATFQELNEELTLVTLTLDVSGATGATVSHPAHIHASGDGSIQYYLSPIDGTDQDALSTKLVEASYDTLTEFDGYVNVHESIANLGNVVSQGNVGSSASGDAGGGSGY
jgi:hypothetical protein